MGFLTDLIDLVLPQRCVACAAAGGAPICLSCLSRLLAPPHQVRPANAPPDLPPLWTIATYAGPTRAALIAYKESGRTALAAPLSAALAKAVQAALANQNPPQPHTEPSTASPDRVGRAPAQRSPNPPAAKQTRGDANPQSPKEPTPGHSRSPPGEYRRRAAPVLVAAVPSSRWATRRRGHDPVPRLGRMAVEHLQETGASIKWADVLRQQRRVADQAGLGEAARAANLAGALKVAPNHTVHGQPIIVIDDVITTGATLHEATRALQAAGAQVIACATIAATRRATRLP
jgi:predicted amidophosphoribosyltransferase